MTIERAKRSEVLSKYNIGTIYMRRKDKIYEKIEDCPQKQEIVNKRIIDLTNNNYGYLTVLYYVGSKNNRANWLCYCNKCGKYVVVNSHNLRTGHTLSCGCLISEKLRKEYTGKQFGYIQIISYDKSINETPYWKALCTNCRRFFSISSESIRQGSTSCGCVTSKNEIHISNLLKQYNVQFKQQYTFSDLRGRAKQLLRFDFAIFYDNHLSHLIEFQGQQHYYNSFKTSEKEFKYRLELDQRKRDYCKEHNIPLIEIKYNQKYDIEDLLLYRTKAIKDEVFQDYKKSSMLISNTTCNFKCDKINGCKICQNSELVKGKTFILSFKDIIERYKNNPITSAVIFGGLEQFDEFSQMSLLINVLRNRYNLLDDIIIYTGYTKEQVINQINYLQKFKNIIIKFNPYLMNRKKRFDELLGVTLSSDNQYSERIS